MYKKITHNIVEEHFDHPVASQIKKSLSRSKIVTNEVFLEDKFRSDVHSYLSSYANYLNTIIDSVTGTEENLILAFDNFFKTCWVDNLGNMTKPIYITEFGERLNEGMRMIATGVLLGIQQIKSGKDTGPVYSRLQFTSNDMGQNLSNFNSAWQYPVVATLFNTLFTDIFNLAKAKVSKNLSQEQQLTQKIASGWATFEKTFVDGIIAQHPERFSKTATMSENFKDIM
jgi:hypothetical protein